MKTRRRSKQLAAANVAAGTTDNEGEFGESSSQITEGSAIPNRLVVTLPDDLDLDLLASQLPEHASLSSPTPDSILALYRAVVDLASRVEEFSAAHEQLKADYERKEVELEQTLVEHEDQTTSLKRSLDDTRAEVASLKAERTSLGAALFYVC